MTNLTIAVIGGTGAQGKGEWSALGYRFVPAQRTLHMTQESMG